jgi:hypothetical protein
MPLLQWHLMLCPPVTNTPKSHTTGQAQQQRTYTYIVRCATLVSMKLQWLVALVASTSTSHVKSMDMQLGYVVVETLVPRRA